MPPPLQLNQAFVIRWRDRYLQEEMGADGTEADLFHRVGPAVATAGYYTKTEMARVVEWKTRRVRSRFAANEEEEVEDITRIALAAPERLQHRILDLLRGVGQPVASAVLTVWAPDRHTVLDFRAVEALDRLGVLGQLVETLPPRQGGSLPDYLAYLECCRALARRLGVSLRDLDRALWMWSRVGMPDDGEAG